MKLARSDARLLVRGLLPDGLVVENLTFKGRQEIMRAIDAILDAVKDIEIVEDADAGKWPAHIAGHQQGRT